MSRNEPATALADRLEPVRERVGVLSAQARDRAKVGADSARVRAAEAASEARTRASDVVERLDPTTSRVADTASDTVRRGLATVALLPDVVARALTVLSRLLSGLAEQGRGVAARIEPPRAHRRRTRLKTAGWFGAGFLAGTVTGWILHARAREEPAPPYGYVDLDEDDLEAMDAAASDEGAYGAGATDIDARRHNTSVG